MTRVLVTGASGFVGRAACAEFVNRGWPVRAALRSADSMPPPGTEPRVVGDLRTAAFPLENVSAVVHLAAIAHQLRGQEADEVYHAVNCAATERLARAAASAGVKRFVFMSSIKVNGERTPIDRPYRASDTPRPEDRYARSKHAAEQALARVAAETGLEVVVVRPPLVYGPGVRANFLRLIRLVERGWPLPLGAVENRRSLVHVGNLADLVVAAASSPAAAGKTLLAADGDDLSTPELIQQIAQALGARARLVPVPVSLLRLAGTLTGMRGEVGRLADSLRVDAGETRALLGWRPPCTAQQGIAHTVGWYRSLAR